MNQSGALYAIAAYLSWGFFPLFWKLLYAVPPLEVLGHRIVWSFLFLTALTLIAGHKKSLVSNIKNKKSILIYALSAILISTNWYIYIVAVNSGHVLEASLGYFINPLINVALGAVFLKEKLRKMQWASVALAAVGVLYLSTQSGKIPWFALSLACTFGCYGLVRKLAPAPSLVGSTIEAGLVLPFAFLFLCYTTYVSPQSPTFSSPNILLLLIIGGAITALPLVWFSEAAKRMPLSILGFFQYIAPSLQFLCAVLIFNEPFLFEQKLTFTVIWAALAIFAADAYNTFCRQAPMT